MSSFNANLQSFNITTENELADVLSHYNSEFVFTIVDEALKSRFSGVHVLTKPNVVGAWEQNFKAIIARYGADSRDEVLRVRNETYKEIIDIICREFDLNFTIDPDIDLYSAAFHLYNLMVCEFTNNMVSFFANFIYRERSYLYDSLGLTDLKKNKDSSTIYSKRVYKDIKLAIINANIDKVITEVCGMEMPFHLIISLICGNNSEMKRYFLSIVSANSNFFEKAYISILHSDIRADVITSIRFKLQELAMHHDQTITAADVDSNMQASEVSDSEN